MVLGGFLGGILVFRVVLRVKCLVMVLVSVFACFSAKWFFVVFCGFVWFSYFRGVFNVCFVCKMYVICSSNVFLCRGSV